MIAIREGGAGGGPFAATALGTALVLIATLARPSLVSPPRSLTTSCPTRWGWPGTRRRPQAHRPGHLLASTRPTGRLAAIGLQLLAGPVITVSPVLRPPRDARSAALRLALGLTLLFSLAPAARFGYFSYPAALLGWLALTGQVRKGASPGDRARPGPRAAAEAVTPAVPASAGVPQPEGAQASGGQNHRCQRQPQQRCSRPSDMTQPSVAATGRRLPPPACGTRRRTRLPALLQRARGANGLSGSGVHSLAAGRAPFDSVTVTYILVL
jgi:hypothetical protein